LDEKIHMKNGNYTRIHNRILEELMKIHLSGYEIKIILAIWRKVYGWRKKEDSITFKQFQKMVKLPKSEISRTLTRLKERNLVVEIYNSSRRTYSFNKHFTTWKQLEKTTTSCRKLHKELEKTTTGDVENYNSKPPKDKPKEKHRAPKETLIKETFIKEKTFSLFDFWNSLKIIIHKNIKGKVGNRTFKGCLEQALKDNTEEIIREAMQNYKTILEGEEYFWKYRWTVGEFLIRGLDKFLTINNPFENFRIGKENQEKKEPNYAKLKAKFSNR